MYGLGLCPRTLIGPKEQIVVTSSQLKSHKWRTNERWSEEEVLLGYDEYSSKYVLQQLK